MERRKSTLTPENYARAVISLSRRYSSTSAFPGTNYIDIAEWLLQDRNLLDPLKPEKDAAIFASTSEQPHDLVVVYNTGKKKWELQQYGQEQHEDFYTTTSMPVDGSGQLVFIRGFVSPSWVSAIGSKYNIDPEFFRRHMDFLCGSIDRHAYSLPSLPSSSVNILRLCVSTLLHRDDFGGQDLQSQRAQQILELAIYKAQQLSSTKVCCGDSLVRDYSTVCPRFSVIEQWISICITKTDKGWSVLVWMDHGRPLDKSPPGPWTHHIESKATSLPVLQHHHKMAFRNTANRLEPGANASAEVPQSTAVLPLQYESILSLVDLNRQAPQDPLAVCMPLFAHTAFSELQFLNLMESKIQSQTNNIINEGDLTDVLGTFQYFSNILNRHARQMHDSHRALYRLVERSTQGQASNGSELRNQMPINNVPPGTSSSTGRRKNSDSDTARISARSIAASAFTTEGLLEDYNELNVRCNDLLRMCSQGITLAMGKVSIEESRKAIEQSQRLKKLTVLATLFIPLGFSTSLFGMNIDLLGQSTVKFWWVIVVCVSITLLAYIFYLWDFIALRQYMRRICKGRRGIYRGSINGRSTKDAAHIV
ncbi:hypothetical protein N0V93_003564 [Gnomoniopsis smithogilvyi]|uniref:Uncharacterized protein n=1 Tax=Gnomoniopsis smithogilvyi TaxID=1191159 RepID=A0A9W9CZZ0_9PEZI|nr:hypothetical protein N0V93_003564 [Gnomoniopsis smithogilvyi]